MLPLFVPGVKEEVKYFLHLLNSGVHVQVALRWNPQQLPVAFFGAVYAGSGGLTQAHLGWCFKENYVPDLASKGI